MTSILYVISAAAPPVRRISVGIKAAQAAGWDVCLVLTPAAHRWASEDPAPEFSFSLPELEVLTGHPVRHQYKLPSQPDVLPDADAMLAVPLTFNSLNKWANGHSDTLAIGLLTEAIGKGLPLVALPHWNDAQAKHRAVGRSVAELRDQGVTVLLGEGGFVPHPPGQGKPEEYPWAAAVAALPMPSR